MQQPTGAQAAALSQCVTVLPSTVNRFLTSTVWKDMYSSTTVCQSCVLAAIHYNVLMRYAITTVCLLQLLTPHLHM